MFCIGWGTTSSGGYSSEILKFASLMVIDNANCSKQFEDTGYAITENMVCATKPHTDTCQGDSGGPLSCTHGTVFIAPDQLQHCQKYRVTHHVSDLGWVDLDLGSSQCWWAVILATYRVFE